MKKLRVPLILLLAGMLLVNNLSSVLAQDSTPQVVSPDAATGDPDVNGALSHTGYLIEPQELNSLGKVQVITQYQPVTENAPIQGWIQARSSTLAVISQRPGEYIGEVTTTAYQFSSSLAAEESLSTIPELQGREGMVHDESLLDLNLAKQPSAQGLGANAVYWEDEDGFQNYGVWFQIDAYVVDVRITAFAASFSNDLLIPSTLSAREQSAEYTRLLSQKIEKGVSFNQLVNRDRAKWFGHRLLSLTLEKLLDSTRQEGNQDGINGGLSSDANDPSNSALAPDIYGSGVHAVTWTHQTTSGAPCGSMSAAEDCHHLATWNQPYGNSAHFVGEGGDPATCLYSGPNGCISGWTWWLYSPISRLGVPKTFYFLWAGHGAMESWFYTATVWF